MENLIQNELGKLNNEVRARHKWFIIRINFDCDRMGLCTLEGAPISGPWYLTPRMYHIARGFTDISKQRIKWTSKPFTLEELL